MLGYIILWGSFNVEIIKDTKHQFLIIFILKKNSENFITEFVHIVYKHYIYFDVDKKNFSCYYG